MNPEILSKLSRLPGSVAILIVLTMPLATPAAGQTPFTLSATTPGGGIVVPNPLFAGYASNQSVTVTATPASGWTFLGWQGDASGTNPVLHLIMSKNLCVQAIFGTPVSQSVTLSGSIQVLPPAELYPHGSTLRLVAQPNPGFCFVSWTNSVTGSQNPRTFTVVAANPAIAAVFSQLPANEYALTTIPNGLGRVLITPQTNRFANGSLATLTALPDPGQSFTGWSGNAAGLDNPLTVTMDRHRVITANFTRHPRVEAVSCLGSPSALPFTLSIAGELGLRYEVQRSTNLAGWSVVGAVTNLLGTAQWWDSSPPSANLAYYRAVLAP
jgi:hypothetical protein